MKQYQLIRTLRLVLFLIFSLKPLISICSDEGWKLLKEADGIKVYSKINSTKGITEMKATIVVQSTLAGLVSLIKDAKSRTQWIDRAVVFKNLKVYNNLEWVSYSEVSVPWPFENRDLVTQNKITQDSATRVVKISLVSKPDYSPQKKGKVRIQQSEGLWQFTPIDKKQVEVDYLMWAESGEAILPKWVTLPLLTQSIYNTLKNMRRMLKENKFNQVTVNYISEM